MRQDKAVTALCQSYIVLGIVFKFDIETSQWIAYRHGEELSLKKFIMGMDYSEWVEFNTKGLYHLSNSGQIPMELYREVIKTKKAIYEE